ncbi:MAG TPA: heparan-alpha-glucosaminide N-acetyltransferase domain-containing protein [Vicinamibacterales bacterium]|nr:heparan-alpha-glucosaminide N-acetyltransferase domain-containing protein [Vicinamibacterales bacterium]
MTQATPTKSHRLASVDLLRGLVIVIMAIDHTREFVHWAAMNFQPEDLTRTTPVIFFTRWITHFCAPVFMFCAGLGAWFRLERTGSVSQLSRYLVTRGLWLIVLEVTAVRLAFFFNVKYDVVFLLVLWALGLCMIALAGLARLPFKALVAIGLGMVLLHNLLDPIRAQSLGSFAWLWNVLHQPGLLRAGSPLVIVGYPIVPWIGVMALGFAAGRLYRLPDDARTSMLLRIGLAATVAFVVVRGLNVYGDPRPWVGQGSLVMSAVSFLNTTKYPPSLAFVLMTLGPALIALSLLDGARPGDRNPLLVFGRTPLLFFVVHLAVIHALAMALTAIQYGMSAPFLFMPPPTLGTPRNLFPTDYGWNLWVVFVVWLVVLAIMYPLCVRFARRRGR